MSSLGRLCTETALIRMRPLLLSWVVAVATGFLNKWDRDSGIPVSLAGREAWGELPVKLLAVTLPATQVTSVLGMAAPHIGCLLAPPCNVQKGPCPHMASLPKR